MARKPVSNSVRFKVFDRDGFRCGYCGRTPPVVILEVDHVIAVAAGGTNAMSNLLTACFECNRGKAARPLGAVPPVDYRRLGDEAKQRTEQLAAYQDYLSRLNEERDRMVDMVGRAYWAHYGERFTWNPSTNSAERSQVLSFIEKIGIEQVIDSARASSDAVSRKTIGPSKQWRYFCGCFWKRARGEQ